MALNLRNIADELRKKFSLQNIKTQAQALPQLARQSQLAQNTRAVLNRPAPNNALTRGIVNTARPLTQPLNQFGKGFSEASAYGLYQSPIQSPQNLSQSIGYGVGFGAGMLNPLNPVNKFGVWNKLGSLGGGPATKLVSKVAPNATGFVAKKLIPSLASEAAQTAGYGAVKTALGQQFNPVTDFATGVALRGLGKFQPDLPGTGKIKVKGIDKNAVFTNEQAKRAGRIMKEFEISGKLSMDAFNEARSILVNEVGKIKTKKDRLEFMRGDDKQVYQALKNLMTQNQTYVYRDLAPGVVGKNDTQQSLYDTTLYHGGPNLGDNPTLKTGYYGGKYTGQDSGAIFFTPSEKYARQYSKTADQVSGLYEYKLPKTERIFDINDSNSIKNFINGAKKWQGYDNPSDAVADAKRMIEEMKATSSKGAVDWATASQFIDEIQQSGFTGAKFLERPGENIQQLADGSFKVSGKPVYSYAMFKNEIPVTRANVAQGGLGDVKNAADLNLKEFGAKDFKGGKIKVYHQTNADITNFNKDIPTFFNTTPRTRTYGKNTVEAVMDIKKPLNMGTDIWLQSEQPKLLAEAKAKGYDAVTFTHYLDEPNQISEIISLKPLENVKTNLKQGGLSELQSKVPGMGFAPTKAVPTVEKIIKQSPEPSSQMTKVSEVLQSQTGTKSPLQKVNQLQSKSTAGSPLPEIINREPIDVKQKVGIFDYLRTPDRVLQKIGLKKESDALRQSYDNYLKELPQEINKVTEWSKQVPKESNQRIFKYLDGQEIQLSPTEMKVAGEIKDYLGKWADKLGLPEEKRITNYITHIFEKDFIKKEFDPELARLIENRVAGSVYDPFTEKRLGKMGYVEDTWRALDAYVKRATRKVNMDPALKQIKEASKGLEQSQFKYVKNFIDRVNMRPTDVDNLVDNQVKQLIGYRMGQRPLASLSRTGRQWVYRGTLGLNPGTALKNLSQGANTYAKLGEKYTIKGYWDLLTKGVKELEDVGVLRDEFIQDRTLSVGKQMSQKLDKALFVFFEGAEKINRGSAYYGAKAKALANGASEQEAIQAGLKVVRDTQFTFGSIDTPVAFQSDVAKLLGQFQSYSLKQAEFLGEMLKNKEYAGLIRYALAGTLLVNTIGKAIGMDYKDLIPTFRIGLPPTLNAPVEIGKALLNTPNEYGQERDTQQKLKDVGNSLIPFLPAGTQGKKTIQGLKATSQGYSETPSGRVRYPVGTDSLSVIRGALFGQYNFPEARRYYDEKLSPLGETQSKVFKEVQNPREYYDTIIQSRKDKKTSEAKGNEVLAAEVSSSDLAAAKEILKYSDEQNKTIGDHFLYKTTNDAGEPTVKSISLDFSVEKPKLMGVKEVDARAISSYKSKLTRKENDVVELWQLGKLTQEEAVAEVEKIEQLKKDISSKSVKPKKITIKATKITAPKITVRTNTGYKKIKVKAYTPPKIQYKTITRKYSIKA